MFLQKLKYSKGKTVNKYDFGYEIIKGSTIEWAFHKIKEKTTILEVGPSIGTLISHLTSEKGCTVDIVEFDEESGTKAARFARNSCLGSEEGDLEKATWFEILKENRYDYIVILDVLEHVRNPKEVMERLKSLLKEDGIILLSIPNIAHNSVILNLLNNKFEYTSVGLLDDTHVHFYTYESVKKLLAEVGLTTISEETKQEAVGNNEIAVSYGMVSRNIEAFLKTRDKGTAYQFLFEIKKGNKQEDILQYDEDKLYEIVVFGQAGNEIIYREKINPKTFKKIEFEVTNQKCLRIDPLDSNCIIRDIQVYGVLEDGTGRYFNIKEHTGNNFDTIYAFYDEDPQLYIDIDENVKKIICSFEILDYDNTALSDLLISRDMIRSLEQRSMELKSKYEKLQVLNDEIRGQNSIMRKQIEQFEESIWGKVYYKLRKRQEK